MVVVLGAIVLMQVLRPAEEPARRTRRRRPRQTMSLHGAERDQLRRATVPFSVPRRAASRRTSRPRTSSGPNTREAPGRRRQDTRSRTSRRPSSAATGRRPTCTGSATEERNHDHTYCSGQRGRQLEGGNMSYAGDLTPQQAWNLLQRDPTRCSWTAAPEAEWSYVGVPDLPISNRAIFIEWVSFPDGARNAELRRRIARGRVSGTTAGRVPLPFRTAFDRCARTPRPQPAWPAYNMLDGFEGATDRTDIAVRSAGRHRPAVEAVVSRPRGGAFEKPLPDGVRTDDPRSARRPHAVRLRGDLRGAVPHLRLCLRERRAAAEARLHRRRSTTSSTPATATRPWRCSRSACVCSRARRRVSPRPAAWPRFSWRSVRC